MKKAIVAILVLVLLYGAIYFVISEVFISQNQSDDVGEVQSDNFANGVLELEDTLNLPTPVFEIDDISHGFCSDVNFTWDDRSTSVSDIRFDSITSEHINLYWNVDSEIEYEIEYSYDGGTLTPFEE